MGTPAAGGAGGKDGNKVKLEGGKSVAPTQGGCC
jgi:hypothetical protein